LAIALASVGDFATGCGVVTAYLMKVARVREEEGPCSCPLWRETQIPWLAGVEFRPRDLKDTEKGVNDFGRKRRTGE
jgi:hypothetical protein